MVVLSSSFLVPSCMFILFQNEVFSPLNKAWPDAFSTLFLSSFTQHSDSFISLQLLSCSDPESIKKLGKLLPMAFTSTPPRKYDVFLSFRGEDTRGDFTECLYQKLRWHNFAVFKDDAETERGITITEKLLRAIEESKTAVVVISPDFASSTWCLDELVYILKCMEARNTILPVFYEVDPSHVRHQQGSFAAAFKKHEERFKEELLKVQLWRAALTKLANFVGWTSKDYSSEVELLDQIVEQVQNKVDPAFTLLGSKEKLVGIDYQLKDIIGFYLKPEADDVRFLGIWGMGGIGKTTLARLVYERVSHNFEGSCFLADVKEVSQKRSLVYLQNQLLSKISKEDFVEECDDYGETSIIKRCLSNRKVLIILDDVNDVNQLETLAGKRDWFGKGSRIIITTRDVHILHGVDMKYESKVRPHKESLQLFSQKAFHRDEPVEGYLELSFHLLKHCQGHSLALKILGAFLYNKGSDIWNSTLDKLKRGSERGIISLLKICYDGLHNTEKRIFLDVACFFRGEHKERVIKILDCYFVGARIWIDALVKKSFLTVSIENYVEMHDLIQELGYVIVHQECPEELGSRSRLWYYPDIIHVLANNKGTEAIEGILLNLPDDHQSTMADDHLNPEAFSKMSNLRFLKIHNLRMSLPLISKHLPNSLRYFECSSSFH